MSIVLTFNLEM